MDLIQFLDDTNIEDFIGKYFNGNSYHFVQFLDERGLLEELMDKLIEEEGMFNEVMLFHYKRDPQYVIDYITSNYFLDVKEDGNDLWMTIDRDDLDKFFSDSDRGSSKDIAKMILSEDIPDFFDFMPIENLVVFIEDLTETNVKSLREYVFKEVEGTEVSIDGEKDIVTLNQIQQMDTDELSNFIQENCPDTLSELNSIHNSAYESTVYDEVYEGVMSELVGLFGPSFSREIPYKRKTYKAGTNQPIEVQDYLYQIRVNNIIPDVIEEVLSWGGYSSDNDFEYYGDFENILEFYLYEKGDLLNVEFPEWADDEKLQENINDIFGDYI